MQVLQIWNIVSTEYNIYLKTPQPKSERQKENNLQYVEGNRYSIQTRNMEKELY